MTRTDKFNLIALIFLGHSFVTCEKFLPDAPEEYELLDGPVEGLNSEENTKFLAGDVAFNDEIFTAETGLGPNFVATSCGSCHAGDGKGHPFTTLNAFWSI
jgi:mono/diheme cytochrome c family protein